MIEERVRRIWQDGWAVLRARWYLRCADYVGPRARVWGRPFVHNQGHMSFGARLRLVSVIATTELVTRPGARLQVGEGVFINYGCSIAVNELVRLGNRCSIGTHVIIMDNDFHQVDPRLREQTPPSAPVILEEHVWLGARVTVLKGVTIGHDSVIGAGSVVTHDIPACCVAAGVPAKVIRRLAQR